MYRILIVDNDKLIRWSLKEIFSQEGYGVDTADTANAAINLARKMPYHLIFTDFEINDGDAIEMLKKIKEFQPEAQIIILSALPKQQIEPKFDDLPVYCFIEKPFKSEHLLSIAKEALNRANFDLEV